MVRVMVKGVHSFTEGTLRMLLRPFGELLSVQMGEGTAMVDFLTMEEAKRAITALHGRTLADFSVLSLEVFFNSKKRIAVKNEYPLAAVLAALEKHGKIYNVKETAACTYIDFFSEADVQRILKTSIEISTKENIDNKSKEVCNTTAPGGSQAKEVMPLDNAGNHVETRRLLKITRYTPVFANDNQTLFIYNLPDNADESDVFALFQKFGEIISCGVKKNTGYVNYMKAASVFKAFRRLEDRKVKGKKIRLKMKDGAK